jgi:Flp pilus assembly pilin Flp
MGRGYQELIFRLHCLMTQDDGQDLAEYALLMGVIAAAVTASSQSFAIVLTTVLSKVAAAFTNALS